MLGSQANYTHIPNSTANTTATITNQVPIYSANITSIVLFIPTTLILHACAVWGLILKYITTAPDDLGYVSTMTRDNPYTDNVPPGGTTLDGLRRARLLAGLRVQLSDVNKKTQVAGQLALKAVANEEDSDLGRIKRGRLYA
ncbi:MAG: hypothetical protein OHK93_008362 [Ramalina farinacea]|uniref:Uncharacterized protein n=1 Tax=Ramalina farinacea TaxID=258253 RepID=A0AA43QP09_9LECA|nr:hypothetical protein [Ramalina farinacea]